MTTICNLFLGRAARTLACVLWLGIGMQSQTNNSKFSITIDDKCVGVLRDSTSGRWLGTGFIADDPNIVVTVRHVAIDTDTNQGRTLTYGPPFTTDADSRNGLLAVKSLILLKR
jgi:S1-C subfamily serine protease